MPTHHQVYYSSSHKMEEIASASVALVVTSPPYPMIEMWDKIFAVQNAQIASALETQDGPQAFSLMHAELFKVWREIERILLPGGIACINIGDATRTINKVFHLFPNHAQIIQQFHELGFQSLPEILWRKQTNAPNKFMGSGMYPPGAYVTLEHEYILIFRKGDKRVFQSESEKQLRRESAYFWEERNQWFSDVWDFKGITQNLGFTQSRDRSGAFPFELAFRLINMFSIKGDMVVDPFLGLGTTILAAMASERNSLGYEIDQTLEEVITPNLLENKAYLQAYIDNRLHAHTLFVHDRESKKGPLKYKNEGLSCPIMTQQEKMLVIRQIQGIEHVSPHRFKVNYHFSQKNHKKAYEKAHEKAHENVLEKALRKKM